MLKLLNILKTSIFKNRQKGKKDILIFIINNNDLFFRYNQVYYYDETKYNSFNCHYNNMKY